MTKEIDYNVNPGYRAHPAIANSDLKYLHSPELFHLKKQQKLEEEEQGYYNKGTLVERYLLNKEKFKKKYIKDPELENVPTTEQQHQFVDAIMSYAEEEMFDLDPSTVFEHHANYYKTSTEAKAVKMYKEFIPYMEFKLSSEGKTIYTEKELQELLQMDRQCRSHKLINRFFNEPLEGDKRLIHKQIIGMEKWGITWKGEIDLAVINFLDKEIYNIDLKTSSKALTSFNYYYDLYRYYRQQALYKELLLWYLTTEGIIPEDEISDWQVKTRCIMIKTVDLNEAYCIPIPYQMIQKGLDELEKAAEKIKFYNQHGWQHTESYHKMDGLDVLDFSEFISTENTI